MISVEQWRRAIGLFGGHRKGLDKHCVYDSESNCKQDPWTDLCCRLFVCAFALWIMNFEYCALNCVLHQPHVNTLLLSNDVETNPGPSVEEQLAALHDVINKGLADMANAISKVDITLKHVEERLSQVTTSVSELTCQVQDLENRQHTINLDIDATNETVVELKDRLCHVEDLLEHQERYSRRENVILHGMDDDSNEDYSLMRKKVVDIFNKTVKIKKWSEEDIQRSHRLGKPTAGKSRPVIVRFHQFTDKLSVLEARDDLKKVNIGVANDLTANQRQELGKLRENGQRGYYKNGRLVVESAVEPAVQPASSTASTSAGRRFVKAYRHN